MVYQEMEKTLHDLQKLHGEPALSMFVKTHRTFPDNDKDPIALKNQLKVAEEHLKKQYDSAVVDQIMQQIHQKTDDLDQNYNLDTLAIFATTKQAQVLRFPFETQQRVVIADHFAVRDILRNVSNAVHYYAVVVTREKGRLIEAVDNTVIHEFTGEDKNLIDWPHGAFPVVTDSLATTSASERAVNEENYLKEFLNRIDKNVQALRTRYKFPLIVIGDKRNIGLYKEVCDNPNAIIATIDNVTHMDNADAQHIIDGIQSALKDYQQQQQGKIKQNVQALYGTPRARTDVQEIYRAALEGNALTLYLRQGYALHGDLNAAERTVKLDNKSDSATAQKDIVEDLIDLVNKNGGQVKFLQADMMQNFEPLVLETRY